MTRPACATTRTRWRQQQHGCVAGAERAKVAQEGRLPFLRAISRVDARAGQFVMLGSPADTRSLPADGIEIARSPDCQSSRPAKGGG